MQHYGLDRLASENNAVAVYLYVPKAVVKRKGFNLEWCDSSADAGPFFWWTFTGIFVGGEPGDTIKLRGNPIIGNWKFICRCSLLGVHVQILSKFCLYLLIINASAESLLANHSGWCGRITATTGRKRPAGKRSNRNGLRKLKDLLVLHQRPRRGEGGREDEWRVCQVN